MKRIIVRIVRLFLVFSFVLLSCVSLAQAQVPMLLETININTNKLIPTGKDVEYAPVKLDGRVIFFLAAPNIVSTDESKDKISPIEIRVETIENKLKAIMGKSFDPTTLRVDVAILNSQTVLRVSDASELDPVIVATINEIDAQLNAKSVQELAKESADRLRNLLIKGWEERQPKYLIRTAFISLIIILLNLVIILILTWERNRSIKQFRIFKDEIYNLDTSSTEVDSEAAKELIRKQKEDLTKKIKKNLLWRRGLTLTISMSIISSITLILILFPYSRELGNTLLGRPSSLVLIWVGVLLGQRILGFLIDWILRKWLEEINTRIEFKDVDQRAGSRLTSLVSAFEGITSFVLIFIGIIFSLQVFFIPVGPILAGAGILGFAISFGSQNLIKDILAGTMTLLIDSYAVGDMVVLGDVEGLVENMNLFFTQLRNPDGELITIPNGSITIVKNRSKDWSRVNYLITVAYDTDIDQAISVIEDVLKGLYSNLEWRRYIIEPPQVLGVEELQHTGIPIRMWIKVLPGQQWVVQRELRRRLRYALAEKNIYIGTPKQEFILREDSKELL